jgi:tetratricopeptide (TPR) repeat protein
MRNTFFLSSLITTVFIITSSWQLKAQPIPNRSPEITEALQKATKAKKMLFLQIQSEKCFQCNDVANMGIRAAKASIDSHCIVLSLKTIPEELKPVYNIYEIPKEYFGVIITDESMNILSVMNSSNTNSFPYIQLIQRALVEKRSTETFARVKEKYLMQKPSFETSMQLTNKIMQIGFEPGGELIDELVRKAPSDSLESISFMQYVLKQAPLVGSSAYLTITKQRDNYNMAWYRMSLRERVMINNRIASKSINKAIADKNLAFANQVAYFRQGTYTDKPEDGFKANMETMLTYYSSVNDTASYLRTVFNYYDRFYMNVQPDDIKREDSINAKKMVKTISPSESEMVFQQLPDSIKRKVEANMKTNGAVFSKTIAYAPRVQFYANGLNEGAWKVYTYSNNPAHLNKAVLYIRKSLEFYETPESIDTYARLLYKTGNHPEAIQWEEKAIQQKRKAGFDASEFEKVIFRMKKSLANIDAD